jgi:hypothetical protein
MAEPYPLDLRTILSASKSRSQPAAFKMAEPRRGYGYVQATGTDTPVFWDVQFRFTKVESARFQLWFVYTLLRGLRECTLPIRTEFGLITHTCRFLPDGLGNCTEEGGSFLYTARIMARAQVIPQGFIDATDLIIALPNWDEWAEALDLAIAEMP